MYWFWTHFCIYVAFLIYRSQWCRLCVWEPRASHLCAEDYLCLLPSDQGRRKIATRRNVPWGERPFSLRRFSFLLSQTSRLFPRFRAHRQNDLLFIQMHFLLFIRCCLRRGIFFLSVVSTFKFSLMHYSWLALWTNWFHSLDSRLFTDFVFITFPLHYFRVFFALLTPCLLYTQVVVHCFTLDYIP